MASTIIIKNGAGSSTPSSLKQGEFAINVDSGKLFYGTSGSSNAVSSSFSFQHVTASGEVSASKVIADTISGGVGQNGLTLIGNVTASGIIDASPSKIVLGDLAANIAGRTITLDQTQTAALQFNMQTGAHIVASTDRFEITDTPGNLSAQLDVKGEITASGEVSSSSTGSFRALNITDDGVAKFNVDTNGHVSASGFISSSEGLKGRNLILATNGIQQASIDTAGNITSTGTISGSGQLTATNLQIETNGAVRTTIDTSGNLFAASLSASGVLNANTAQFANNGVNTLNISNAGAISASSTIQGTAFTAQTNGVTTATIDASGNISSSGTGSFNHFFVSGEISGSVSASGTGSFTGGVDAMDATGSFGYISASTDISASGIVYGSQGRFPLRVITDQVQVGTNIVHDGDTTTKIEFADSGGAIDFLTEGSSRIDLSNSGVRLGGANARVTTILDEDNLASDSDTSLATQQSIKAYVDANAGGSVSGNTFATDLKIGRDADNLIDFTTDNQVTFRVSANDGVVMKASGEIESTTLRLTSTTDASATSTGHAFQSGPTNGANIIINGNEVMARNNGSVAALYLNPDGGLVAFQNSTGTNVVIENGNVSGSAQLQFNTAQFANNGVNTLNISNAGAISASSTIQGTALTLQDDGINSLTVDTKGHISASGTGSFRALNITDDGAIKFHVDTNGHVSASGDISSSAALLGRSATFASNGVNVATIDASGNISSSGALNANTIQLANNGVNTLNVSNAGAISASSTIQGMGFTAQFNGDNKVTINPEGAGIISASGAVMANSFTVTNNGLNTFSVSNSGTVSASRSFIGHSFVAQVAGNTVLTTSDLGDVSGSGTGSFRALNITDDGVAKFNVDTNGHVSASGDISSSATLLGTDIELKSAGVHKASIDTSGNADFEGNLDVNGTTNLDDVDIDGNVDLDGNLTMGENSSGHTLSVFGNSTGVNMTFNVSNNDMLKLGDNTILGVGGGNNAATSDLEIVHNGTDSIINNKTGNLIISASVTERIEFVGNITASGNISASGDLRVAAASDKSTIINSNGIHYNINGNGNGTNFRVDDTNMRVAISTVEFEVVANKIELGSGTNHHVTASGNISSSGAIISPSYQFGNRKFANASTVDSNGIELGNVGDGNLLLTHLTASGNISASGQIQSADIITNRIIAGDNNTIVATTGTNSLTFNTPITASGNISSSADVLCKNLTVDDGSGGGISFKDSPGSLDLGHISYIEGGVRITATDVNPAGTGHLVVSSSGGTGTSNVLVGIGTETPGEMLTVMGNISASGNIITDKITAHAPFSSDSLLNLHDDNVVNANGVTLSSIGSMVFMLDSNDTGTVDKIEFRADSQDASAGNLLATIEDNGDFAAEGNITASGNISSSGTLIVQKNQFSKTTTTDANHQGDVVFFGGTTSMTAGKIYYYNSSGNWAETDADAESTAKGLLAVALGTASDTNGMLLRGTVTLNHDPGAVGDVLYLSTTAGQASSTVPSGNGDIVRVIGYCLDASNGQIWFNPDNTFVEVSA